MPSSTNLRANVAVAVVARRPHVDGPLDARPVRAARRAGSRSSQPRFDVNASFNEVFTSYRRQRADGDPDADRGRQRPCRFRRRPDLQGRSVGDLRPVKLVGAELAAGDHLRRPHPARRRLSARNHRRHVRDGRRLCREQRDARPVDDWPSITGPLGCRGQDPDRPGRHVDRRRDRPTRSSNFDASGTLRMVNFPGGGAARIETADVIGPNGARVRVSGGDGVTYYWPPGRLRIDG